MKRTLLSLFAVSLLSVIALAQPAPKRPNVLFLFANDMRADTIAAHGNPHIKTPNLDALSARGFSFRGNYVFGGNQGAVCVPNRAADERQDLVQAKIDLTGQERQPDQWQPDWIIEKYFGGKAK